MQNEKHSSAMTPLEKRSVSGLAAIFGFRMLGLFMIFPVFTLHAAQYTASTPLLIGLAMGAYGLTQALFQIPFGMMSDRFGRKRMITIGLLIFAVGSVVAAQADSIYGVIFGRLLQGSGAVAAAIMALTADLTRDEHRTKAMASIGISIGLSFSLALAVGAALANWFGLSGLFWLTAALALVGIVILHYWVPTPPSYRSHVDMKPVPQLIGAVLRQTELMRLCGSIFILHLLLTLSFYALPISLTEYAGLASGSHGWAYLPVLLLAFACMVPLIIIAEKGRKMKPVLLGAIASLALAEFGWSVFASSLAGTLFFLWLFFTAFNLLEASLPSLMSKLSPLANKGTAMGVYSTAQFLGAFSGGVLGGVLYQSWGVQGIFLAGGVITLLWVGFMFTMPPPVHLSSRVVPMPSLTKNNAATRSKQLQEIAGIVEVVVNTETGIAHIKYQPEQLDEAALSALTA